MERNLRSAKTRGDENVIERTKRLQQIKQLGPTIIETKRAALGDLGNRNRAEKVEILKKQVTRGTSNSQTAAVEITEKTKDKNLISKHTVSLRNVKPRVNTHWNKDEAKKISRKDVKAVNTNSNNGKEKELGKKPTATGKVKTDRPSVITHREESKLTQPSLLKLKTVGIQNSKNDPKQYSGCQLPIQASKQRSQEEPCSDSESESDVKSLTEQITEVKNIDLLDGNLFLVPEYANDIYSYLRSLELEYPIREDHLSIQTEVTPRMRTILIDWINELHYQFHLLTETFFMTVGIIDRYLQEVPTTKQQLQLVGVSALFIATKYEELYPPEVADLSYMTDHTYTKEEILMMEEKILKALEFNLSRPVATHFLRRFSRAAEAKPIQHEAAKYTLELASMDYTLAHYRPSVLAAASLHLSLILFENGTDLTKVNDLWTPTLRFHSTFCSKVLMPTVVKLAKIIKNAPQMRHKSVYTKYQSEKFDKVALKLQSNGEELLKLKRICDGELGREKTKKEKSEKGKF